MKKTFKRYCCGKMAEMDRTLGIVWISDWYEVYWKLPVSDYAHNFTSEIFYCPWCGKKLPLKVKGIRKIKKRR